MVPWSRLMGASLSKEYAGAIDVNLKACDENLQKESSILVTD